MIPKAIISRRFNSAQEFFDSAEFGQRKWPRDRCASLVDRTYITTPFKSAAWAGSATFDEAMRIARQGWPEGRARMAKGLEAARLILSHDAMPQASMDVAGAYPIVPVAVAGDPAHMVSFEPTEKRTNQIIRLLVPRGASWRTPATCIENYGIALLSIVDSLEQAGHSVEITISKAGYKAGFKDDLLFDMRITAKQAGEPLDLDRLAFVLAHPAFLRRLVFAIMEQHTEHRLPYVMKNYGVTEPLPPELIEPGVNYLPTIDPENLAPWQTLEGAIACLQAHIKQ